MTILNAFSTLATVLLAANPTPESQLTRVIVDYLDNPAECDRPFAVLRFADDGNSMSIEALELGRLDYTIKCSIILGGLETPLSELHSRAKYWPLALLTALTSNISLSAGVAFTGGGEWRVLFTIGTLSDYPDFFGLTLLIPVTEKPNLNSMG